MGRVAGVASENCFMTSLDDKAAFHHILLRPLSWPLVGFSYKGVDYVRRVLPFEFKPSLWVFHTLQTRRAPSFVRRASQRWCTWMIKCRVGDIYLSSTISLPATCPALYKK